MSSTCQRDCRATRWTYCSGSICPTSSGKACRRAATTRWPGRRCTGQGRVFYGSFSHAAETWDMRTVQLMYLEAIKWSLGLTDAPGSRRMPCGRPPRRRRQSVGARTSRERANTEGAEENGEHGKTLAAKSVHHEVEKTLRPGVPGGLCPPGRPKAATPKRGWPADEPPWCSHRAADRTGHPLFGVQDAGPQRLKALLRDLRVFSASSVLRLESGRHTIVAEQV